MRKGDKFQSRKTRRIVYYIGKYWEVHSNKIVINYNHPNATRQIGAMYKDDFKKEYRPLK